jgi:hypothetical protein
MNEKQIQICSICSISELDTPKFYYNSRFGKNLCNKHYLQLKRKGKITDKTPNIKLDQCEICGHSKDLTRCGIKGDYIGKTLCRKHYGQIIKYKKIIDESQTHRNRERICEVCGSTNSIIFCTETNQMLCRRHYDHIYNYGQILKITVRDRNNYIINKDDNGDFVEIILRNSKHEEVAKTIIDLDDLHRVLNKKWRYEKEWGYVSSGSSKGDYIMLQNFILDYKGLVDHIDRDTLNNRKNNLMPSNKSLNALNCGLRENNKSGVTGVSFNKNSGLWRIYINWEGARIELGYKKNIEDAIKVRLLKENELLGKLAPQRHLFNSYGIVTKEVFV